MKWLTHFAAAVIFFFTGVRAAEARPHRRWYELRLSGAPPTAELTRSPRRPPPLDLVTGVAEKILRGPAAHVALLGSVTFDRMDALATGLVGSEWKF